MDSSPSRRDVLAAAGVLAGVGAGYYVGATVDSDATSRAEADWPHPDYDAANTRNPPAASAPNADDLAVAWRHPHGHSNSRSHPVVANGNVYTATVDEQTYRLRALSVSDGEESWQREEEIDLRITPPLVVASGASLYYRFLSPSEQVLGAVSPSTGDRIWDTGIGTVPGGGWTVGGGRLYHLYAFSAELRAYDAESGDHLWTTDASGAQTIAAYDSECGVLVWGDGRLTALDPENGSERWSVPFDRPRRTVVAGGVVVVSEFLREQNDGVVAFDAGGGDEAWRYELSEAGDDDGAVTHEAAAGTDDVIVIVDGGVDDSQMGLNAVATASGDRRWRVTPPAGLSSFREATVVGDSVYVCGYDGSDGNGDRESRLLRLSLDDGTRTGSWPLPGAAETLVVADEQVLVQTETELVAFE